MDQITSNQGGNTNNNNNNNVLVRDYRKGNWTLQETMVLIEAKKMDDERRMKRVDDAGERGKPTELRWKWVEDYCWKKGCLRSQNQCNDKWDNLMRDFKKVREYERRVEAGGKDNCKPTSYWRIVKNERKDNNLPSNMLPQIYEALVDAVERKLGHWQPLPPATLPPPLIMPTPIFPSSQASPAVETDDISSGESPAKRRKKDGGGEDVGEAISRSATIIAEAIQSCEEREERRHGELVRMHQRRLQIEESKAEINRQAINGLVDAINKLASSILALATPPPPSS